MKKPKPDTVYVVVRDSADMHLTTSKGESMSTICLHDLPDDDLNAPGQVCCWFGDIFLPRSDAIQHGQYKPKGLWTKDVNGDPVKFYGDGHDDCRYLGFLRGYVGKW
jgi:hypothetical protein